MKSEMKMKYWIMMMKYHKSTVNLLPIAVDPFTAKNTRARYYHGFLKMADVFRFPHYQSNQNMECLL